MSLGDTTMLANPDVFEQIRRQVQGEGPVVLKEGCYCSMSIWRDSLTMNARLTGPRPLRLSVSL